MRLMQAAVVLHVDWIFAERGQTHNKEKSLFRPSLPNDAENGWTKDWLGFICHQSWTILLSETVPQLERGLELHLFLSECLAK